jgi:hypothetical protein
MDREMMDLNCQRLQLDELWAFRAHTSDAAFVRSQSRLA